MEFEAIYEEHFLNVYRYVYSMCRDAGLAEEITQEAFFKAMENLEKFDGRCRLFVWLCQIAKNTYFTYLKKQRRHISHSQIAADFPSGDDMEAQFVDQATAWQIHQHLHELEEPYKEVFSLRVFGELPFDKIGMLFGKSDSWARVIYFRAKQALRRRLDEN